MLVTCACLYGTPSRSIFVSVNTLANTHAILFVVFFRLRDKVLGFFKITIGILVAGWRSLLWVLTLFTLTRRMFVSRMLQIKVR